MRLAGPAKPSALRAEQIILFRVGGQLFAISSASVQEVRSADSLSGASVEINAARHGQRSVTSCSVPINPLFIVDGTTHFGISAPMGALVFVLRKTRTALLIDGIEKMTSMTRLQALPQAFLSRGAPLVSRPDGTRSNRCPGRATRRIFVARRTRLLDASLPPMESCPKQKPRSG